MDKKTVIRLNKNDLHIIDCINNSLDICNRYKKAMLNKTFEYDDIHDLINDALICLYEDVNNNDLVHARNDYCEYFNLDILNLGSDVGAPEENTSESE